MIKVNGQMVEYQEGLTVTTLLQKMKYNFPLLIVKINGVYVPRDQYASTPIPDGSEVDVIHLISGG